MTQSTDFFDGIGGGPGHPSPLLKNPGDWVDGTIVEMSKRDYIPYDNRKTREPARKADGSAVQQLVVVLQTTHRNWENTAKVPVVDPSDPNSPEKAPSEDDGLRSLFVPEGKNIQFAIGRAVTAAQQPFLVGGRLQVKVFNLKDTGRGEPLKEHEARYMAPSAGQGFLNAAPTGPPAQQEQAPAPAQQAPPVQQQAAPAQQDPWATPAAPAQPAAGDPWATPGAASTTNGPPF